MTRFTVFSHSTAVLLVLVSLRVLADSPGENAIRIVDVAHHGDGCRAGTVGYGVSDDGQAVTFIFDEFTVEADKDQGNKSDVSNCNLIFKLDVPPGWQFTVTDVDFRGYANVSDNAKVTLQTNYALNDQMPNAINFPLLTYFELDGPYESDFAHTQVARNKRWSACSSAGNLSMSVKNTLIARAEKHGSYAVTYIDSADAAFSQHYALEWRQCGTSANIIALCKSAYVKPFTGEVMRSFEAVGYSNDGYSEFSRKQAIDRGRQAAMSRCLAIAGRNSHLCQFKGCTVEER